MPSHSAQACPERRTTESLAAGELAGQDRSDAEQHLEQCEPCRALFGELTAERFPKFAGYTIISEIDRGGFGVVYKAFHQGKGRVEALKVLVGQTALREEYFANEVHLVARFSHPNIATLYEAHLSTPPLYFAMEFVAGQRLDDYFRRRQVSLAERIEIIRTVASAIEYAHRQGVIHRDIKPQNILVDAQGTPHIVDFGISRKLGLAKEGDGQDGLAPEGHEGALGTYGYIAPEQLAGQRVDTRADIFGLGALLFHVITGEPARAAAHVDRVARVLRERHARRADDMAAIIACAVSPLPEQRYATCAELVDDLGRYLAGRKVRARKHPPVGYRIGRIAAFVLRYGPVPVQVGVTAVAIFLLSVTFWLSGAHWLGTGSGTDRAALIAFSESTLEAIRSGRIAADLPGFSMDERKSWRLLYGQLMERLADAKPLVVVWDYYFPDAEPEFDPGFVEGAKRLGMPVVVGSKEFDINGEPFLCPAIRGAVQACGAVYGVDLAWLRDEFAVPLAVQRGLGPPIPSLSLAGFAAARFPDSDVDIRVRPNRLSLCYRKRQVGADERRWHEEIDDIPVFDVEPAGPNRPPFEPEDRIIRGRFRLEPVLNRTGRVIAFEDVLTADAAQRRRWFSGRAVVIGQMIPGSDVHRLQSGLVVFGCEAQVAVVDALLAGVRVSRFGLAGVALRVGLWCALAAVLANFIPIQDRWSLPRAVIVVGVLFGLAFALASFLSVRVTDPRAVEVGVVLCAVLAAGGPILLARLLRQRELRLTSEPTWSADSSTASTTLLARGPDDS